MYYSNNRKLILPQSPQPPCPSTSSCLSTKGPPREKPLKELSSVAAAACSLSKHLSLCLEQSKPTGSPGLPPLPQGARQAHAPPSPISQLSLLISGILPQGSGPPSLSSRAQFISDHPATCIFLKQQFQHLTALLQDFL